MDEEELLEQNLMRIARGNARTLADTCRANEVTGGRLSEVLAHRLGDVFKDEILFQAEQDDFANA